MDAPNDLVEPKPVVLTAKDVVVDYAPPPVGRKAQAASSILAVNHVSFRLHSSETLGIVGESGSGKSTLGYAMMNLVTLPGHIVGGELYLRGIDGDVFQFDEDEWEHVRGKHLGLVAQGSQNIFNPIMRFDDQFSDMFAAHRLSVKDGMDQARNLLKSARLPVDRVLKSYPHELSGGMRQRVSIVSSLMMKPEVLILDEPTTALDVMSQAIVLDSLKQLKEQQSTAVIFISHDVAVVSSLCDKIAVMYGGRFVEVGSVADIYFHPRHPYTEALLKAIPSLEGESEELVSIAGQPPDLAHMPPGCAFAPRCPVVMPQCHAVAPEFIAVGDDGVACHRHPSETGVSAYA